MARGRRKEYTPETLKRAVNRYFASITRTVTVKESVPTGRYDAKGHAIFEMVPVLNSLGKETRVTEYIEPPTIGGLAEFLGIHRSTWDNYCDNEKNPEFFDTTTCVRGRIHAYLERESLTRAGKDLKGVLFNLENNYNYCERVELVEKLEDIL